jgi:magnesium-transporting ATPase (P-type)
MMRRRNVANGIRGEADAAPDLGASIALETAAGLRATELLALLRTRSEGLSAEEAEAVLRLVGPNRLPRQAERSIISKLMAQLTHFFAVMLWVAAALAAVGGMPQLSIAIVCVVLVNGVFSFAQEERASRAATAIIDLLPVRASVIREGRTTRIDAEMLVPGDVVVLKEGDRISADARLTATDGLLVDMSTLTGESQPVARFPTASDGAAEPSSAENLVFAGTHVVTGSATAVVFRTGSATALGTIAQLTGSVIRRPTPLQIDLHRTVKIVAWFAVAAGGLFFGVSLALGTAARDGFLFAVGVIVALVPEGLLPTVTLALAMSALRMSRRGALIRRSEAVETLGATTVICSDKTGTMTTNQMTVRVADTRLGRVRATGLGWGRGGSLFVDDRPVSDPTRTFLHPLLRAAALCGDAELELTAGAWHCVGDPTEGALVAFARKGGVDREAEGRRTPRTRSFPFDSRRMRMSTLHVLADGSLELLVKGAPESVLARCDDELVGGQAEPLDAAHRADVLARVDELSSEGLRVLALASREIPRSEAPTSSTEAERSMTFLGLAGLEDPIRPEVPPAIARCREAGIRVVMVTGDHPHTAASVARAVGIEGDQLMLGRALPKRDDELRDALADPRLGILARIEPEQKLRIAAALQQAGHVVAMTGDGVNDAPALRQADIGVAMGIAGTDVAREAADVVLLDDNFVHIVEAVEEGRGAFDNARHFLTYHLTDNVAELAPFAVWALSGGRFPLLLSVLQVLALDIGTDLLPALALGAERPAPGTMQRRPRSSSEHLLDRSVLVRAFGWLGPIEAFVSMGAALVAAAVLFGWMPGLPLPTDAGQLATMSGVLFAAVVVMQMANAFGCRSESASVVTGGLGNRLLMLAVVVEGLALAGFLYVPAISRALAGAPPPAAGWLIVLSTPLILTAAEEARKAYVRRLGTGRGGTHLR